jgi:DNA-directed RNA polymerase sigma subunit (sigma70/sigma32)
MSDERKISSPDRREGMPSGFAGLTPKEAKILVDRFGLTAERQPDDVDERTLRDLARKLVMIKKKQQ